MAGLTGALLMGSAHAALLEVTNPSFELPATPADSFITGAPPTGWANYGFIETFAGRDVGVLNPAGTLLYPNPVPDGSNVAVVFLLTGGPTESGIQQTLTDTLQAGLRYTLEVSVGNIAPVAGPWNFAGFPGYRVDLLAGGQVVATDNNTLLPGEGEFLESTVSVVVGADHLLLGQPLGIRLVSLDGPNGIEVNFDNVRLNAVAVPEPATSGLATAGFLGVLAVWNRRRVRDRRTG
jgi:hypothetical protein